LREGVDAGTAADSLIITGDLFDYGPQFAEWILTVLPPRLVGTPYQALVPRVDPDGNNIAGIRLREVAFPLATYTGWNLRAVPTGGDDGCDQFGQQINFAGTKAERRPSALTRGAVSKPPGLCECGRFGGKRARTRSPAPQ
jgi:hypothetical protein